MNYQAKLITPFGLLGISCSGEALTGITFLALTEKPQPANNELSKIICVQLQSYLENPDAVFSVPLGLCGTGHQIRVWQALSAIPRGQTLSYGELAKVLGSSAQAVGQACGANPIPIIIPCHRVVGRNGLGGFMHHASGGPVDIKRWLLVHEGVRFKAK